MEQQQLREKLEELEGSDAEALKARWHELYGVDPPKGLSAKLMRRAIGFKLQVRAHGPCKPAIRKELSLPKTSSEWISRYQVVRIEGLNSIGSRFASTLRRDTALPKKSSKFESISRALLCVINSLIGEIISLFRSNNSLLVFAGNSPLTR